MRILGVDRVPSTPFERGDAPRKPVLTPIAGAHPQGQARARRARHGRGRDLVVHLASRRPSCSAAASPSWRSPIRSRPTCPTCGRASFRAWSRRRSATPTAAFPTSALFEVGQIFRGDQPEDQFIAAPACAARWRSRPAAAATGRARPATVDAFDAKADALAALDRGRRAAAGAAGRAGRAGVVSSRPLAAPSRSGRRTCSAISANCIRARWRRSTPRARSSRFEVILERIPEPKAKADPRQAGAGAVRRSSRSSATSPSWSIAA